MKAFGIYAGGGVKGAALAGCLAAAEQQGVQFVGHGGTSAGSIIALMAAVGYSGQHLERILVDELEFSTLLEDSGVQLKNAITDIASISSELQSGWIGSKLYAANVKAPALIKQVVPRLGLYSGQTLKEFVLSRIGDKRPELKKNADITFEHLEKAGCLPLKIVASDITNRRPAIFSREDNEYGASVIDAIRASTSYPFAFEPVFLNGRRLVDGGLSSNLPVFLFAEEYRHTRIPAIAFDLVASPRQGEAEYGLSQYGSDLLATALEASDDLLRRVLRGVHYVPVVTPPGINTLDFGLPRDDRRRLFDAGLKAATAVLSNLEPIKRTKMAGDQLQRQLWTEYGPPQFYFPVLKALAKEIEEKTQAQMVRVNIMLPTGRPEASRIVTYSFGMDGTPDADLELPENAGCSGQSWHQRTAAFADLQTAAANPSWGMSPAQHAKVPEDRKSMLSVPIHGELLPNEQTPPAPVGTLSVDSITPLRQTGWVEETSRGLVAHAEVLRIIMRWSYIIHKLLS